jgi:glycosyltransferase involved in cell wall biosynthesis
MKIVAVVPAYNEEKNIKKVVCETKKYVDEVIVVNDGSVDKTAEIARESGALVVNHIVNMGLGFALMTGSEAAFRRGADIIVTIDGDAQHDPREIKKLVKTLVEENLDIVIALRPPDKNMPLVKRIGNSLLYLASKALFNVDIKDTQSGFRAYTVETYKRIKWKSLGYPVASEIVKNIGQKKLKYREVEVKTVYPNKYKGTTVVDGIKIFLSMLWWRVTRR